MGRRWGRRGWEMMSVILIVLAFFSLLFPFRFGDNQLNEDRERGQHPGDKGGGPHQTAGRETEEMERRPRAGCPKFVAACVNEQ